MTIIISIITVFISWTKRTSSGSGKLNPQIKRTKIQLRKVNGFKYHWYLSERFQKGLRTSAYMLIKRTVSSFSLYLKQKIP
jgi:hypothetical protein